MGFISRKLLPACGNMCVCCPALRPSSRRPVKRYKKLLAELFPRTPEGRLNERKILKLCEYAAKNPLRIPKIAHFLEQRCYRELRSENINSVRIVTETYGKLLYICKEQLPYYANSLLNIIHELLEDKHQEEVQILGCQTLSKFVYSQADNTFMRDIEGLVQKACHLAHGKGETRRIIRAASLQCLSAMVWFMTEYLHIFADFDEIVCSMLDNYRNDDHGDESHGSHHHWVDEVIRCEMRGDATGWTNGSNSHLPMILQTEIKDPLKLTREESETPEVWARICLQKIAELAKEGTTLRRIMEPIFDYFDCRKHWNPRHGLAFMVLSDMSYLLKNSGTGRLFFASIIRHLDHKNVVHDSQTKADIVQIATTLVMQLRSQTVVAEIAVAYDLLRHLRKTLQAIEPTQPDELNWNLSLQKAIEDCLLEIAKGIGEAYPLYDVIALTLEKLPTVADVARATIGSLLILAHIINLANVKMHSQVFPEALLLQLLKAMMHSDRETRIKAHQIFSVILVPKAYSSRHELELTSSKTTSVFASATALLEKLRREKGYQSEVMHSNDDHCDLKDKDIGPDGRIHHYWRSPPDMHKSNPILEESEADSFVLSEDQAAQLLSAFWVQANQPDNLPSNFEAISSSLILTVLHSRMKKANDGIIIRFFQFCLSLLRVSMEPNEMLSSSCRRSLYTLAASMLAFSGKVYQVPDLMESGNDDAALEVGEDLQLSVRPNTDLKEFGSVADQQEAEIALSAVRQIISELKHDIQTFIVRYLLLKQTNLQKDELMKQLSESFVPEDGPLLDPNQVFDWEMIRAQAVSEESLSLDEELSRSSSFIDGNLISESPAASVQRFVAGSSTETSLYPVISVGKLLESALQVAGQVAGSSVSTSPLPYGAMANQCEALGAGTRRKLSSWLSSELETVPEDSLQVFEANKEPQLVKVNSCRFGQDGSNPTESWIELRLPPASPFDNFLKAARC